MSRKQKHREQPKENWEKVVEQVKPLLPKDAVKHAAYDGGRMSEHTSVLDLRTHRITIGIPLDEVLFSQFFVNFELIDKMPWDNFISTTSTYLPDARNKIHNTFLNDKSSNHLFMLDSDVLPPPKIIKRLLAHNTDCVGGWYRKKEKYSIEIEGRQQVLQRPVVYDQYDIQDGLIRYKQKLFPGTGVEDVGAAGAGCWMMSRKLCEALGESPYSMDQGGEDMVICRKITAAGFKMYIDWSLACAHIGTFFV
jgi:hypothetical protein